jgi:hypothetical protein
MNCVQAPLRTGKLTAHGLPQAGNDDGKWMGVDLSVARMEEFVVLECVL